MIEAALEAALAQIDAAFGKGSGEALGDGSRRRDPGHECDDDCDHDHRPMNWARWMLGMARGHKGHKRWQRTKRADRPTWGKSWGPHFRQLRFERRYPESADQGFPSDRSRPTPRHKFPKHKRRVNGRSLYQVIAFNPPALQRQR